MLINQSLDQLFQIYGEKNKFMGNCQLQVFYTANDNGTGEYVSKAVGNETIRILTNSGAKFKDKSQSEQFTGAPLIASDQLRRLPLNRILIILGGKTPIMTEKIRYFTDPQFKYWSKDIPLITSESCYNIDKQYTYNNPLVTFADIEFLTGDNRTKYVNFRYGLDDEWLYAGTDDEIYKANLNERIWLINQKEVYGKDTLGWQNKPLINGLAGKKMQDLEPNMTVDEAKFINAREMLKKANMLDEQGNLINLKYETKVINGKNLKVPIIKSIKGYQYKPVSDPQQKDRKLDKFLLTNPYDIYEKQTDAKPKALAGSNVREVSTSEILARCAVFYASNKNLNRQVETLNAFDGKLRRIHENEAKRQKELLEQEKLKHIVTDDDTDITAKIAHEVVNNPKSSIETANVDYNEIKQAEQDIKAQYEEDFIQMYGQNYETNYMYLHQKLHMTEEQTLNHLREKLGTGFNSALEDSIRTYYSKQNRA